MKYFEKLDTRIKTTYSTDYFSGDYNHEIYLMKANDDGSHRPKYYLRAVTNINGVEVIQGYLYFYIDYDTKTSEFIGIKVHEEFRDLNIGSLLVSLWIDLCLNNGIDFLGSNKKQRKPFLIYLLKTFGFEILDKGLYKNSKDLISICRRDNDLSKLYSLDNFVADSPDKNLLTIFSFSSGVFILFFLIYLIVLSSLL